MATKSKSSDTIVADSPADRTKTKTGKVKAPLKTKKERLQTLLRRKGGATAASLQKAFGWQPHTVRAAISGIRKTGETVECTASRLGPVYRIVSKTSPQ